MKIDNKIFIKTPNGNSEFDIKKFHKRYSVIVKKNISKEEYYYIFQKLENSNKKNHTEQEVIDLYNKKYEFFNTFEDLLASRIKSKKDQKWILDFIEVKENLSLVRESINIIKTGGFNKETQEGGLIVISERKNYLIDCLKHRIPEAKTIFGKLNIVQVDRTESFVIEE